MNRYNNRGGVVAVAAAALALSTLISCAFGMEYVVGDGYCSAASWGPHVSCDYNTWALQHYFAVVFKFNATESNVAETTKDDYGGCVSSGLTPTNTIKNHSSSPATITLTKTGTSYLISTVDSACTSTTLQLAVTVNDTPETSPSAPSPGMDVPASDDTPDTSPPSPSSTVVDTPTAQSLSTDVPASDDPPDTSPPSPSSTVVDTPTAQSPSTDVPASDDPPDTSPPSPLSVVETPTGKATPDPTQSSSTGASTGKAGTSDPAASPPHHKSVVGPVVGVTVSVGLIVKISLITYCIRKRRRQNRRLSAPAHHVNNNQVVVNVEEHRIHQGIPVKNFHPRA